MKGKTLICINIARKCPNFSFCDYVLMKKVAKLRLFLDSLKLALRD